MSSLQAKFECSFQYFAGTATRSLSRKPVFSILGVTLVTFAAGYVTNTGAAKYSGYAHDGWLVRVWIPLILIIAGILVLCWTWMFGHGGECARAAVCDCGKGACCGNELCADSFDD